MKKKLIILFACVDIACVILTVVISNTNIVTGSTMRIDHEKMFELNATHEEVESNYLKLALEHVAPKARASGFIAVEDPQYIRPDAVVGFLTR